MTTGQIVDMKLLIEERTFTTVASIVYQEYKCFIELEEYKIGNKVGVLSVNIYRI
jgi:hypothetical protein